MKTRTVIYALLSSFLFGCASYQLTYDIKLDVEQNISDEFSISDLNYEDEYIKVNWTALTTQFSFSLENKTSKSIKIIWDEAVFVGIDGSSGKVMHSGVKYVDRANSQPPSVIIRQGSLDDMVVPTDNVYYVSGQYGGWRTRPILQTRATTQESLNQMANNNIGKSMQILMPLEINGKLTEYIFVFDVEGFQTVQ